MPTRVPPETPLVPAPSEISAQHPVPKPGEPIEADDNKPGGGPKSVSGSKPVLPMRGRKP